MTINQFNTLKIGDRVLLPNNWSKGTYTSTEVLEIDRVFKKVRVLLNSKFLSYKYIPVDKPMAEITSYCGACSLKNV